MVERHSLVLGGTGFVGARLVNGLVERGRNVVVALRSEPPLSWAIAGVGHDRELVAFLAADTPLEDVPESVIELVAGSACIYDLAADATYGNGSVYATDARRTARLASLIKSYAPPGCRLVFTSSIAASERPLDLPLDQAIREDDLPTPRTDYGAAKLEAERAVLSSGIPVSVARLGWVIGRGMRPSSHIAVFARLAIQHPAFRLAPLKGIAPLIHVSDAVDALILLGDWEQDESMVVNVASDNVRLSAVINHVVGTSDSTTTLPSTVVARLSYKARCLLRGELSVDNARLRSMGWAPRVNWSEAVDEVAAEARDRIEVGRAPQGATIVTGAASGLGRELSTLLAATGRTLILVDRDSEAVGELADSISATAIVGDVTESELDGRLVAAAAELGGPSELFMCAGVGSRGRFGLQDGRFEVNPLQVNLVARARLAHVFVREMRLNNFGRLVMISSSSALVPMPEFAAYSASNAGLLSFGVALADEWRPYGIKVLTVLPGGMQTNFQASSGVRQLENEKLMDPADVARDIIKALDRDGSVAYVGARTRLLNVAGRTVPRRFAAVIMGRLARAYR